MTRVRLIYLSFVIPALVLVFIAYDVTKAEERHAELTTIVYRCLPCGLDCDTLVFDKPGSCLQCNMRLVDESTIRFKTIQPSDICRYIQRHPDVVLLDVRTREEFEGRTDPDFGTLKNAINLPVQELDSGYSKLEKYKDRDIIVYCSHSHRSPRASYMLGLHGFTRVTNMAGGMSVMTDTDCKK